jgi:membrane-bound inhibitor of C-type lysozyme
MLRALLAVGLMVSIASPAFAEVTIGVGLSITGDAEIKNLTYDCGQDEPLNVEYVNAAPNFLAVLPVRGEQLIFVATLSASGAKYQSGSYVWWDKGSEATLSDTTEGLDAAPVLMCTAQNETP